MFVFLLGFIYSTQLPRQQLDNSFIKVIDDNTMRDAIRKEKSAFVMFHADHARISDVAYAHYVRVANEYKKNATFFVVPAGLGTDVMRSYSVAGTPALLHFRLGTKTGIHQGFFSYDSVHRFIANWTAPRMIQLSFRENVTGEQVFSGLQQVFPDRQLVVAIFGDKTTKYGRCMFELADELGVFFPFVNIKDEHAAKALGLKLPSLVMIRFEDSQHAVYKGEPDVDEMFIWTQHFSIPQFRNLDLTDLFSPDGVSVRSAIAFLDVDNIEHTDLVFPTIGKYSSLQNWVKFYYANIADYKSLTKLFNIEKKPSILYLSANYTHCGYAIADVSDNETFTAFYEENLTLNYIKTPPGMYGVLRPVTEFAFEKLSEEGPFFALFTSAFCTKCKTLKNAAIDAAKTIYRNGGNVNWAFWDVTQATPSFQSDIQLGIPSVWYFPTGNLTQGTPYAGPPNFLSIIEWVNGFAPEAFDLDAIMTHELGGGFDEI
ncbi:hypothetical protein TRFO_03388 [Tritrichomonas foetus]|uniref:Thioredoxin domain-containing protein n=1 Tax=Tritrichomonas foetus TaxID=1144522 RepID=A0A1J4KVS1_9EUKA|nr:hypothetical protein TRFO_03388 [Tritrichomonas foetus]|eukprot:OHT13613.1 hypothetical protein TRFO_03388 [Tritrichomonas foetus]